jgi:hypothetical protein
MTKTKENQNEIIFTDDVETRTYLRISHERDLRFIQMKMYNHALSAQCSFTYNDAKRIVQFLTKQLQLDKKNIEANE